MTAEVAPWFSICVGLLGVLIAFVWRAAVVSTSYGIRLDNLEKGRDNDSKELRHEIEKLEKLVESLRDTVNALRTNLKVSEARQSQGQFAETDRPPRV